LKRRRTSNIIIGCVAGAIALHGAPAHLGVRAEPVQVELDAFSGLPNPVWELPASLANNILTRLRALRPAPQRVGAGDGLGYRGFVIRPNGDSLAGYDEIRIARGSVLAQRGDRLEAFSDPDRSLERLLLESARAHVQESVLQFIQSQITQ
jgi:hypothetical protein